RRVAESDEALARARARLGALLGDAQPTGVGAAFPLSSPPPECRAAAPEARTDVEASRVLAAVAAAAVGRLRLELVPTLDFVTAYSVASAAIVNNEHRAWTVGGLLSLPLWNGVRPGAIDRAQAVSLQSREKAEAARRLADLEQSEALRQIQTARAGLRAAELAFRMAAETERLTRAGLLAGGSTTLELIDAGTKLRDGEAVLLVKQAELAAAELRAQLVSARCEW